MGRHAGSRRHPQPERKLYVLLIWTLLMSILILGSVLELVHPEV